MSKNHDWLLIYYNNLNGVMSVDVKIELEGGDMIAYLNGEIDHHGAAKIRNDIDLRVEGAHPYLLILDFTNVSFMDSSGIGLIMGRYKLMKDIGGALKITNPSPQIKKVMKLAGIDRLAVIEQLKQKRRSDYFDKK